MKRMVCTLAVLTGVAASAQAAPYLMDNFTYQGSTPSTESVYTQGFNSSHTGDDIGWVFNWPDDDTGATSPLPGGLRVNYDGSASLDEQTQVRNDVTLTTEVKVEMDTRSIYASGNYMEGLILSESTDPWTSGKSLFFGWNDVQGRWEIRTAVGPISGTFLSSGSTLLGTVNVGRNGWPVYDHLTITRSGGSYSFDVNGSAPAGVSAFSGNFQYAGALMGVYGLAGQTRFDNLQYTDLAVPEPAGLGMAAIVLAGVCARRRRR